MRSSCRAAIAASFVISIVTSTRLSAAVNVGDTPRLEISTINQGVFRLSDFRGRVVMVYFWSTGSYSSIDEIDHLQDLFKQYGPKGMAIVGICSDNSSSKVQRIIRDKNIAWGQHVDVMDRTSEAWGVYGLPRFYLIDRKGAVVWSGKAKELDDQVSALFDNSKDTAGAPTSQPAVSSASAQDVQSTIDKANEAIDAGKIGEAVSACASIPASASKDPGNAAAIQTLRARVEQAISNVVNESDALVKQSKYAEAVTKLKALQSAVEGSGYATRVKQKLTELQSKPEARKQIEQMDRAERAAHLLASAQQLATEKNDDAAYEKFKMIARDFADAPAAADAVAAVAAYEGDADFVRRHSAHVAAERAAHAKAALGLAEGYRKAGKLDQARAKYQEIIDQFPDSREAQSARTELQSLGK